MKHNKFNCTVIQAFKRIAAPTGILPITKELKDTFIVTC